MTILGWFRKRRWHRVIATLAFIFTIAKTHDSKAGWSRPTQNSYERVQRATSALSPGAQTDSEREHVIQALIVWVKSLSEDVVKSVRKDDHVRAYQNLDEFLRGMDVLRTVGRAKDVKKEYDWVKHNMKSAKRRLEAEPSAISLLLRIKKM